MTDQPGAVQPGAVQPGAALAEFVAVMDRLRRECPWDMEQTHASLAPYLLEETYEALDALDRGNLADLRDELGDVLLQVVFHARVASERADETGFDLDDVAAGVTAKLVRRHPHVFGDVSVADADEVRRNWTAIKAAERTAAGNARQSVLDGIPVSQPALSLAAQLQRRAESAGAPPELADLSDATGAGVAGDRAAERVSELGAELFELVTRARAAGLNPELELRHAARIFSDRVRTWESSR